MSAAPTRLSRLLAMVPYFQARQGIKLSTAAADLGVTEKQLVKDLEQLFLCGLPGYMPDDLIDLQFYDGYVNVGFTAGMDRPLRLTGTEASVLLVALRMLLDARGALDADAVRRAMVKLEEAAGGGLAVVVHDAAPDERESSAVLREAVAARRAVALQYYTPSRDAVTDRVVDPVRVAVVDGHSYLDAWCRESAGRRLFRFDRVQSARPLDEPSSPPVELAAGPVALPTHDAALPVAVIEVDPDVSWVIEYYDARVLGGAAGEPGGDGPEDPDTPVRAELTYASDEWLARLVQGFGGRVRVVSGDDGSRRVRERIADAAAAARARYAH